VENNFNTYAYCLLVLTCINSPQPVYFGENMRKKQNKKLTEIELPNP